MSLRDEFIAAAEQLATDRREAAVAAQQAEAERERRRQSALDAFTALVESRTATEDLGPDLNI